jgi:hypothetical protein
MMPTSNVIINDPIEEKPKPESKTGEAKEKPKVTEDKEPTKEKSGDT